MIACILFQSIVMLLACHDSIQFTPTLTTRIVHSNTLFSNTRQNGTVHNERWESIHVVWNDDDINFTHLIRRFHITGSAILNKTNDVDAIEFEGVMRSLESYATLSNKKTIMSRIRNRLFRMVANFIAAFSILLATARFNSHMNEAGGSPPASAAISRPIDSQAKQITEVPISASSNAVSSNAQDEELDDGHRDDSQQQALLQQYADAKRKFYIIQLHKKILMQVWMDEVHRGCQYEDESDEVE